MSHYDLITARGAGMICQGNKYAARKHLEIFDLTVFCAIEVPPPKGCDPRRVLHIATHDDIIVTPDDVEVFRKAGRRVADRFARGERILVACNQGRNRSGFVTAFAIHYAYGVSGAEAARMVRSRRRGARALTNPAFNRVLERLPASPA